jgi:hypothetical protein
MITLQQRGEIAENLADFIGFTRTAKDVLVTLLITPDLEKEVGFMPLELTTVPSQAEWIVGKFCASRWHCRPSLMERLLTLLLNQGAFPRLGAILAQVKTGIDPGDKAFDTLWVQADQPFLDRRPLRASIRELVDKSSRPVLRVNGASSSGKSYTTELLNHVMAEIRPDLHVVPAVLSPGAGPLYELDELADSMTYLMPKRTPFPGRSSSSYAGTLCRWVVNNAKAHGGIWIFVLDGFAQQGVKLEITDFIQLLAQQVMIPEAAKHVRLVLLHFDSALSGNWRPRTMDDGPLPAALISKQELVDCLTQFNDQMKEQGKIDRMIAPEAISTIADDMIEQGGTNPCQQLCFLHAELTALATI